jgi:hypothetical protein
MNGSLYLSPAIPHEAPARQTVYAGLSELLMCGPLLFEAPEKRVFAAGAGFARHVIYAGCSPHLRFEPAEPHDRDYCHLALLGPYATPMVITGENTVKPRCPHCRARRAGWQDPVVHAQRTTCPECAAKSWPWELDWRQQAAAGRFLIELRNVFPGEASPSDRLLASLRQHTGMDWNYAWAGMSPEP